MIVEGTVMLAFARQEPVAHDQAIDVGRHKTAIRIFRPY